MKSASRYWGFTSGEKRAIILICVAVLVASGYRIYQHAIPPEQADINAEDSIAVEAIREAYLGSTLSGSSNVILDTGDVHSESRELLDLNRATRAQLEKLPGIGPVLAARILELRGKAGRFTEIEDLLAVQGIGSKRLETIRPLVTCGEPEESGN